VAITATIEIARMATNRAPETKCSIIFVLEPATLALHATLLTVTAVAAALYPMQVVARLPIAATLRNEVLS